MLHEYASARPNFLISALLARKLSCVAPGTCGRSRWAANHAVVTAPPPSTPWTTAAAIVQETLAADPVPTYSPPWKRWSTARLGGAAVGAASILAEPPRWAIVRRPTSLRTLKMLRPIPSWSRPRAASALQASTFFFRPLIFSSWRS